MHLVLFTIDGTILLGQGIGARAMERAGRRVLGPEFSLEGIDFGGALDPWIYREAARRMQAAEFEQLHAWVVRDLDDPEVVIGMLR